MFEVMFGILQQKKNVLLQELKDDEETLPVFIDSGSRVLWFKVQPPNRRISAFPSIHL